MCEWCVVQWVERSSYLEVGCSSVGRAIFLCGSGYSSVGRVLVLCGSRV